MKTNILQTASDYLGLSAMAVAAGIGLVEFHEARGHKTSISHVQPAYAYAISSDAGYSSHDGDRVRREKEEIRHAGVGYGVSMRSHPTAGSL